MSSDVKCTGRGKCHGDHHDPRCAKYVAEMAKLAMKQRRKRKPDPRKRHDGPPKGETPEEKAARAREIGKLGGRPLGVKNLFPIGAVKALRSAGFRVKDTYKDDENAKEVAGYALERLVMAAGGLIHKDKAPSSVKASAAIRAEICEPVETKSSSTINGSMTLEQAVNAAAEKVTGGGS